jgi:hypothetical protein
MDFVHKNSIVRQIWGKSDTILFIFAGASAEFALNKAVDWLYFTGKLPKDPIGRLFSTVSYARKIVFSPMDAANKAIDSIAAIHGAVEKSRGASIPDWAYRDVLFMLIHYSIASFELLERKLSMAEKEDVYDVFFRMGVRMGLKDLPSTYKGWLVMREDHLKNNLAVSIYTKDLFKQYRLHLGPMRYYLLKQGQVLVVPTIVNHHLKLGRFSLLSIILPIYKIFRLVKLDWFLKSIILPGAYKKQIKDLDVAGA